MAVRGTPTVEGRVDEEKKWNVNYIDLDGVLREGMNFTVDGKGKVGGMH